MAASITTARFNAQVHAQKSRVAPFQVELLVALGLLLAANVSLLHGQFNNPWLFLPGRVAEGEWWRVPLHPWVHVSWYHLLLDATAFLVLYHELRPLTTVTRVVGVIAAGVGSLVVALCFDPTVTDSGLCGLSGIAHGLMAIAAMETMRSSRGIAFGLGFASLLLVVGKCVAEAITGTVVFDFLHAGRIGAPVAVSHGGGVLGALLWWALTTRLAPDGFLQAARSDEWANRPG